MSDQALVEMAGVVRDYAGSAPLRVGRFRLARGDRFAIAGFDTGGAETFINLITGAALPDHGDVHVAGRNTRDIATDTEWLVSLDRIGIVTARAVLIEKIPIVSNLALPLTLAIDPMTAEVRRQVEGLAAEAGLALDRLDAAAGSLSPEERVRVHLARSLALGPELLLLERPTVGLDARAVRALGETIGQIAASRVLALIALTDDEAFAKAAGATRLRADSASGQLRPLPLWQRLLS